MRWTSMTSEAYVHARRQGGGSDIVGRYRVIVPPTGRSRGEFEYAGSWLRNDHGRAFALDPENMPLQPGTFIIEGRGLLPGALADTTPDRWGRRLLEAKIPAERLPLRPHELLLATSDERVGCLSFSPKPAPPQPKPGYAMITDLSEIAEAFSKLDQGQPAGELPDRLWRAGNSLGGARPKAAVEHEGTLWLAKFARRDDTFDQCHAERATMLLAQACGMRVAETQVLDVGPRKAILVKRFDRDERMDPSCHYLSGLSALGLDETSDRGSYRELAQLLTRHGSDQVEDRHELFRRMVFNVLCGNRDDHLKNHAFLRYPSGDWRLSPAFDVLPQPDFEPQQAIAVGQFGSLPTIANCLTQAGDFNLSADEAKATVGDIKRIMSSWRRRYTAWGVPDATIARVGNAFSREIGDDEGCNLDETPRPFKA